MPIRTVPKNYRSLTGLVLNTRTQSMTAFESSLERDFLLLLDFDPEVEYYEEQPVAIHYQDSNGQRHTYTPDVWIRYRTGSRMSKPQLCEVKYRADLRQYWVEYRPKFRAAQGYARQQGWRFRLVSEQQVRTPYLDNVKFLRPYRTLLVNCSYQALLLNTLTALEETDPANLLTAISQDRRQQAQMLPLLWQLIATRQIGADLSQPLNRHSRLWLQNS